MALYTQENLRDKFSLKEIYYTLLSFFVIKIRMLTISSPRRRCPPWRGVLTNDKGLSKFL